MDGLITLADLPELKGSDPKPHARIVIGRLDDKLRDPRYGKFKITQEQVDGWKRNLSETFGGQVSMDFDHSSDRGGGTRAAAWIRRIDQTGNGNGSLITADVEFTRRGAKAVRNGDYKYTSPTFVENYVDEHGTKHGPALIGAAMTNRPVLRKGMPTLSLSRDHFDDVATAPDPDAGRRERRRARAQLRDLSADSQPARDSRRQMAPTREDLIKLLGLDENADSDAILAATVTLAGSTGDVTGDNAGADAISKAASKKKASKRAKKIAKKLAAETDGKTVTLSADQVAELVAGANAGAAAAKQLAEDRFDAAWTKALSEGRAAPKQEDTMRQLHKTDPDLAIKTLDELVQIVPTAPTGSGGGPTGPAPDGMDDERYQLHHEAKALAAKKLSDDSSLDESEAYILATQEIEDRKFAAQNPGI